MNPDIERLAKEAGIVLDYYYVAKDLTVIAKFAALIAEECAKVVDQYQDLAKYVNPEIAADAASDAIRSKFPRMEGKG